MTTKKTGADPIVAAADIMIDGKSFAAGDKITGVDKEQLAMAVSQKRAVPSSVYDVIAAGVPAPEFRGEEPEAGGDSEDESEGADA